MDLSPIRPTTRSNLTPTLHQQGTSIVDDTGAPVRLRGVNLGAWLHWEGYLFGAGVNVAHSVFQSRLASLVGQAAVDQFTQQVYDSYITGADLARIAELGFNAVRIPINYRLLEDNAAPYQYKQSGWAALDSALALAEQHGIYVILDLHSVPGGQSAYPPADPSGSAQAGTDLWGSAENQARTVALWQAIASRYSQRSIIAGYDLLNEPDPPDHGQLVGLYQQIIDAIRATGDQHLVILEGAALSGNFSALKAPLSDNQAYSFHLYALCAACPDIRDLTLGAIHGAAARMGVPLYVGEFGENTVAWNQTTLRLLEDPAYDVAGWSFWTWKRVVTLRGVPNLTTFTTTPQWKYVAAWLTMPGLPRPPVTYTLNAMSAFLQSFGYRPEQENPEMVATLLARGLAA